MTKWTKIFLVLSSLYATHAFATYTKCDLSVQAVTDAFGENYTYITPETDLFKDLLLVLPQVSSVLLKNWGDCRVDLNVAYGGLIRKTCSRPACLSKLLQAGRY